MAQFILAAFRGLSGARSYWCPEVSGGWTADRGRAHRFPSHDAAAALAAELRGQVRQDGRPGTLAEVWPA